LLLEPALQGALSVLEEPLLALVDARLLDLELDFLELLFDVVTVRLG
jgi:hypothetical protein